MYKVILFLVQLVLFLYIYRFNFIVLFTNLTFFFSAEFFLKKQLRPVNIYVHFSKN